MLILALETSTEAGSCALWQDGKVIERRCPAGQSHSATLLPLVRELLAEAACRIGDLDAVAFGCGPGAFTGLRVACAAAQGLAEAAGKPVVPVVGLAAMAAAAGGERVMTLLDARMGEVYAAVWQRAGDRWVADDGIRVGPPADLSLDGDVPLVCGNALSAYPELAARVAGLGLMQRPDILPEAAWIARLAVPVLQRGEAIDPAQAAPLYVRDKVARTVAERLADGGKA